MEKSLIAEWELQGDIGVLTINNPPQNYLEGFQLAEMDELRRWTRSEALKGMIIVGRGRHFCAGFNKADLCRQTGEAGLLGLLRRNDELLTHLEELPIPIVAAMNGACLGGGLELALSCDIRVCGERTLLSFPETGIGIIPGVNGAIRLPRRIGQLHALELVLEGRIVHAEEALALGLVDHVVPTKEVLDFSLELLKRMTAGRRLNVIHSIVKSLHNTRKLPYAVATAEETRLFSRLVLDKHAVKSESKLRQQ